MDSLIARLEAVTEGSRELDEAVYNVIGRPGDNDPQYFSFLHGDCPPNYTTSIDAVIPGENIVSTQKDQRTNGWRALAQSKDVKIHIADAGIEPLARRAAALKAMQDK